MRVDASVWPFHRPPGGKLEPGGIHELPKLIPTALNQCVHQICFNKTHGLGAFPPLPTVRGVIFVLPPVGLSMFKVREETCQLTLIVANMMIPSGASGPVEKTSGWNLEPGRMCSA